MPNNRCICDGPGYCQKRDGVTDAESFAECQAGRPPEAKPHCVYLGKAQPGRTDPSGHQIHDCRIHQLCTTSSRDGTYARCRRCKEKLLRSDPEFHEKFVDGLRIIDRHRRPSDSIRNHLAGGDAFLVCGGPSANENDLSLLSQRGVWSLTINNMGGHDEFVPNAFVCADPPSKFCDGIWLDPNIMKIIPTPKLTHRSRGTIRRKRKESTIGDCDKCGGDGLHKDKQCPKCDGTGRFAYWFDNLTDETGAEVRTVDCPNVWGFERTSWLSPDDTFFLHGQAMWGNHNEGVIRTGEEKTVCTTLLGIRILYYLGARTIYLVGNDFRMDSTRGDTGNYAFAEGRTEGACRSNNEHFVNVNNWLCRMVGGGVFERFGLSIYNTFERSGLRAFPYVPFVDAVNHSRRRLPSEPYDLANWYEK